MITRKSGEKKARRIPPRPLLLAIVGIAWGLSVILSHAERFAFTLDFEEGDCRGWSATGNAFIHQPTLDDNPTARHRGQTSQHQGRYWIGTFENYQGHIRQKRGDIQGDGPQGTLTSAQFTIPPGKLSFLIGGGSSPETRVELLIVEGTGEFTREKSVCRASGKNNESMNRESWDLTPFAGKTGKIRIVDNSSGQWGHINVDDFRFTAGEQPVSVVPEKYTVPDLSGLTPREAKVRLGRFLRLGDTIETPSNRQPGTIVRQAPPAGSKADMRSSVRVWVADGRVDVPNLMNLGMEQAKVVLSGKGLAAGRVGNGYSDKRPGTVIGQEPQAGTRVAVGSAVDLRLAAEREKPAAGIYPESLNAVQGETAWFESRSAPLPGMTERWLGPGNREGRGHSFEIDTGQLSPGRYEITLMITANGREDRAVAILEVLPAHVEHRVTLTVKPDRLHPGQRALFRADLRPEADGVRYQFIFHEGEAGEWIDRNWTEYGYEAEGNYRVSVIARFGGKIIESAPVAVSVIPQTPPPQGHVPWKLVIAGILGAFAAGGYLSRKLTAKRLATTIEARPHSDVGIQQIEADSPLQPFLEIRVKPVSDPGKQSIEANGALLMDERRVYE
jgi:hypothetical protein